MKISNFVRKMLGSLLIASTLSLGSINNDLYDRDYDESYFHSQKEISEIVNDIEKSTYRIKTIKGRTEGYCNGFAKDNKIYTSAHCVLKGKTYLEYEGEDIPLRIIKKDDKRDVAILKPQHYYKKGKSVKGVKLHNLKYPIGKDDLETGDVLIVVGNPFNIGDIPRYCRVEVPELPIPFAVFKGKNKDDYFIHNCPTYFGDSGSPIIALFDGEPQVVGLVHGSVVVNGNAKFNVAAKLKKYR